MKREQYFKQRRHLNYYQQARALVNEHAMSCHSILDVGSRNVPFAGWFPWITDQTTIDLQDGPRMGINHHIRADFLTHGFDRPYDLVTCLQVLEHVERAQEFARKLFCVAQKHVLISVPYRWPEGFCRYHRHDPVDDEKLAGWTGRVPDVRCVVRDGHKDRLLCWYEVIRAPAPAERGLEARP